MIEQSRPRICDNGPASALDIGPPAPDTLPSYKKRGRKPGCKDKVKRRRKGEPKPEKPTVAGAIGPDGKRRPGRPKGSGKGRLDTSGRADIAAKKLNLGAGMVPQATQTRFHVLNQLERIAQYWLALAHEEDLLRAANDKKYNEHRRDFALSRALSALATLAPYRHARINKMPEPLELSRLNKEELLTFRALFIKAMGATTSEHQGGENPKNGQSQKRRVQ